MTLALLLLASPLLGGCVTSAAEGGWRIFTEPEPSFEYPTEIHQGSKGVFDLDATFQSQERHFRGYYEARVPAGSVLRLAWMNPGAEDEAAPDPGAPCAPSSCPKWASGELRFPNAARDGFRVERFACAATQEPLETNGTGYRMVSRAIPQGCEVEVTLSEPLEAPRNGISLLWSAPAKAGGLKFRASTG